MYLSIEGLGEPDQLTLTNELRSVNEFERIGGRPYVFQIVESGIPPFLRQLPLTLAEFFCLDAFPSSKDRRNTVLSLMVKMSATHRRSRIMEATPGKSAYWSPHRSPYLTVKQAEEYTTLHRVTLWRACRQGKLRASGYGRAVRYHVKDLNEFMASRYRG